MHSTHTMLKTVSSCFRIPYWLSEMKPRDIESYISMKNENSVSNSTLLQYPRAIKEALQYAVELELIQDNPADK